jgi:hypothetical protein
MRIPDEGAPRVPRYAKRAGCCTDAACAGACQTRAPQSVSLSVVSDLQRRLGLELAAIDFAVILHLDQTALLSVPEYLA